jgi:hypothetical protein
MKQTRDGKLGNDLGEERWGNVLFFCYNAGCGSVAILDLRQV